MQESTWDLLKKYPTMTFPTCGRDSTMTPAEKLAKEKDRKPAKAARRIWKCNLREIRLALNLSQRDVACAVGLSCAGYHQIETCGNDVCLSTCVKLSEFFGKSIMEIWEKP